jgi:hypothetical protein
MWKPFWYAVSALFLALAGGIWAASQSTFLFRHPTAPDARIEIDYDTRAAVVVAMRDRDKGPAAVGVPRAEVPEREFDFGTMNPLTMGRHEFLVRNTGTAPLELRLGPTTCKCTLGKLKDNLLPPGEETHVTLEWNTGRKPSYSHGGTLFTNDPDAKQLELLVSGKVLTVLDTEVDELVFSRVLPGAEGTAQTFIYSSVWSSFEVLSGECSLAGATWSVEPCPLDGLPAEMAAKHAQLLTVKLPADLPAGKLHGSLRLQVREQQSGEQRDLVLPIQGTVLGLYSVYGPALDGEGGIELGKIPVGRGKKAQLVFKVYDEEATLDGAVVTAKPDFVQVKLKPGGHGQAKGLYQLSIEVPSDAPVCQHQVEPRGRITIDTGHPRIGLVEMPLTFAVVPKEFGSAN